MPIVIDGVVGHLEELIGLTQAVPGPEVVGAQVDGTAVRLCVKSKISSEYDTSEYAALQYTIRREAFCEQDEGGAYGEDFDTA